MHNYVGIVLVTESGHLIGQLRDDIPGIDNPGRVATFGGTIEDGETVLEAALRELSEETNLALRSAQLISLCSYEGVRDLGGEPETRHFLYAWIDDEVLTDLEVNEGCGWTRIEGPDDPRLIEGWRQAIAAAEELARAQGAEDSVRVNRHLD